METKIYTCYTAPSRETTKPSVVYPESKVILDPTCTIEQILNRAQFGMPIPQRDLSGDLTSQEIQVLGLNGTSFATMTRMELIDLKMRAQTRLNALRAKQMKLAAAEEEAKRKRGIIDEYLREQSGQQTE